MVERIRIGYPCNERTEFGPLSVARASWISKLYLYFYYSFSTNFQDFQVQSLFGPIFIFQSIFSLFILSMFVVSWRENVFFPPSDNTWTNRVRQPWLCNSRTRCISSIFLPPTQQSSSSTLHDLTFLSYGMRDIFFLVLVTTWTCNVSRFH